MRDADVACTVRSAGQAIPSRRPLTDPERGSRDCCLPVVYPALHDHPHAEGEQEGEQHRDAGRGHGARGREQERSNLRQDAATAVSSAIAMLVKQVV